MGSLNLLSQIIHTDNIEKGFYERKREIPEFLMLIVSELSEAMEADRSDKYTSNSDLQFMASNFDSNHFSSHIKNTFEDEMADSIIRILDLCAHLGIDIDKHVELKLKYNKTRPYKHSKAY